MNLRTYAMSVAGISLAGALFSGSLSAIKLFTNICALDQPCPYFLGYPSCFYGFAMFLIILAASLLGMRRGTKRGPVLSAILGMSLAGTAFAAYFAGVELLGRTQSLFSYSLGLPVCIYGLLLFIAILTLSVSFAVGSRRS